MSHATTLLTTSPFILSGRSTNFHPKREPFPVKGEGFISQHQKWLLSRLQMSS